MGFKMAVKKSEVSPWENKTSNFYWGADGVGTYNAGSWDAEFDGGWYRIYLDAFLGTDSGAWTDGYQPTQVRFFFTGTVQEIYISNSNGSNTIQIETPISETAYSLSGLYNDSEDYIDRIEFHTISTSGTFNVSAVEFSFL